MNKIVIITGAAGFIGRYICKHFSCNGWQVVGVDSAPAENAPTAFLSSYSRLSLPSPFLGELIADVGPSLCIHCAGRASVNLSIENPLEDYYSGPVLVIELLETLRKNAPACRMIHLSSAAVYGNPVSLPVKEDMPTAPISPYGFHKLHAEQICSEFSRVFGLLTTSVRIFSAYGPGLRRQVLWDMCCKLFFEDKLLLQGSGLESRDFIHVHDVARAIEVVSQKAPMAGEVYNVASGQETTIAKLSKLVLSAFDSSLSPEFNGLVPKGVPYNWCADITKLSELGFVPAIPLERGVPAFVQWCKAELGEL